MHRAIAVLFSGSLLMSCFALKDISAAVAPFDNLQKEVEAAPAFFIRVAADFEKTSQEYRNLSGQLCTALPDKEIVRFRNLPLYEVVKGKRRTLDYAEYEARRFSLKGEAIRFLNAYAATMKERIQASESFSKGLASATSAATIIESIPVVGTQATVYTTASKAIIGVLDKYQSGLTAEIIQKTAAENQKSLEKFVKQLKREYDVIDDDAKIYLDAWAACKRAKMRALKFTIPGLSQTTVYEYDAAFSATLQQAIDYKKAVPSVDDELDAIVAANKKIAAGSFETALTNAQEMIDAASKAYNAVKAVQGVAGS